MARNDIDVREKKAASIGIALAVVVLVLALLALLLGIMEIKADLVSRTFDAGLIPLATEKVALYTAFFAFAVIGVRQVIREKSTQLLAWAFLALALAGIISTIYDVSFIATYGTETEGLWDMNGYLTFDIVNVLASCGCMLFCIGKLNITSGKAAAVVLALSTALYIVNWFSDSATSKFSFTSVASINMAIVAVTLLIILFSVEDAPKAGQTDDDHKDIE